MYLVKFKNGFFEVHSETEDLGSKFPWLTAHEGGYWYFLANYTTRKYFIQQMLQDPECTISDGDKEYLRTLDLRQRTHADTSNIIVPTVKGKPFKDYQLESVQRMMSFKNYCLFLGPGTGKTIIAITYLNNAKPHKVLIVTPKKVVGQYVDELGFCLTYTPDVTVTHYENISSHPERFLSVRYDCVILDESHKLKNYMSKVHKTFAAITTEHMFLFTGTPQDKSEAEVAFQLELFDKRFVPSKSKFLKRYFILDEYYNVSGPKAELIGELRDMIKLVSYGKQSEEVIELTKANEIKIAIPRPTIYDTLKEERVIDTPEHTLVLDTAGKCAEKLREVCNGFIVDDNKKVMTTDSQKPEYLRNLVATMDTALIFTQFKLDIPTVTKVLDELGRSYGIIDGSTNDKTVNKNRADFENGKIDFLVMQSASGNAGLDLWMTNNEIFYSLPSSYIVFEQCKRRIRRLGQTRECNYYYLLCTGSVETHMFRLLSKKKSFNAGLYSIYK